MPDKSPLLEDNTRGALMMLAGIWFKPLYTVLIFGLAVAGTLALNMSLLINQQLMLPLATPLATPLAGL